MGIIHSIIWLCLCCAGSTAGGVTIFCCTHMLAPTSIASMAFGAERFRPRNELFNGIMG